MITSTQKKAAEDVKFTSAVEKPKLGIVNWQYKDMSKSGSGEPIDYDAALAAAKRANSDHPEIHHWVDPVLN